MIAVKSDTIYQVRTRRDVLILHHDKLKVWQAHELLKWICNYQVRTRVIVETAGEEQKQVLPEKKDERGEGSVVLKTGNQIILVAQGDFETVSGRPGNIATASESQGHKRRGSKRKRYEYCLCKTRTAVALIVQCDQCKD